MMIPGLHYLRGILALIVVFYHWSGSFQEMYGSDPLAGIFRLGFIAVDIFFILSGVVVSMSSIQLPSRAEFIVRRFSRIFAIYWIALLLVILIRGAAGMIFPKDFFRDFSVEYVIRNILLLPVDPYIVGPAWSLTYELGFYIFFAVALFGISSRKMLMACLAILSVLMLGIGSQQFVHDAFPKIVNFFVGVIGGVLIVQKRIPDVIAKFSKPLCFLLTLYFATLFWIRTAQPLPGVWWFQNICITIPGFLLILSLAKIEFKKKHRLLWFFGDTSYSIYIFHAVFLMVVVNLGPFFVKSVPSGLAYGLSLVLSVAAIGAFSWLYEKRLTKKLAAGLRRLTQLRS